MTVFLAQVTFEHADGLAELRCINTFHFDIIDANPIPDIESLNTELKNFYNASLGGATIAQYISPRIQRTANASSIRWYRLSDPKPRAPLDVETWTLGPTTDSSSLPQEVAFCLSYRGSQESGLNMARRRGRIYIGPLALSANGTAQESQPITGFMTRVRAGAVALRAGAAAVGAPWVVYSPTGGSHTEIVGGWTDNAWDTQRRRGSNASARITWA